MTKRISAVLPHTPVIPFSPLEGEERSPLISKTNDAIAVIKKDKHECKICALFHRFIIWLKSLFHPLTQLFKKIMDKSESSAEVIPTTLEVIPPRQEICPVKVAPTPSHEVIPVPVKREDITALPTTYAPPKFINQHNNCWYHSSLQIIWAMGSLFYEVLEHRCRELGENNIPPVLEALKNLSLALQFAEANDIKKTSDKFEELLPKLNHSPNHSQKDPSEAFFGSIFPFISEFFINIGKRELLGEELLHSYPGDRSHLLHLHIPSDCANLQQILNREFETKVTNAEVGLTEKTRIKQMPNPDFIFLQMVRFDNNLNKIATPIELSPNQRIDLSKAKGGEGEKIEYELIGAIIHEGASMHGGHYVANVLGKNPQTEKPQWYFADDTTRQNPIPISTEKARNDNRNGYIYLFRKVK